MVLLNRIGNVLGLSSSSKRAPWWPVALLALALPLAIWLASTNVHSSTENQMLAAELNKAPLDKAELERWVEKAKSPVQSEFDAAVDALVAMGPEVAREMIPLLKTGRTDQLGLKVLKRLAPEPSVQRILINAIEEARPNRHPNVIHCGLLALGKSGNVAHAGFIAGFLETHDLAAMSALETLGGERARDHLIGAFDQIPTEHWFVLAGKLERLGDPAAVPELKKRLTQVELPPNDRFPPATVGAMTGAISALSDEQETFTTREYCQGQHFQYPFDGPGSPKTFSVNPLKDHYVRLPKVDPQTEAGREAIWKALAESTEAPGFTIDGNEMVTFHGLKTAPLWPDGRPYPITLYDWLRRTSHQVLLDLIEQEKQTGRTAIPRGGLLVALDPAGRLYVLSLKKTSEQFTYDVTVMPQDPNMQLIPVRADAEAMQLTDTASCTLHDLESETKDGSLNLSRGHYVTMTQEKWQAESTDAVLVAEFAGNQTALGIPGAEQFVLAEAADAWEEPEKVLSLLKAAAKQEPTIAGHESLEQDGAIFHTFSRLSEGQKFAFAVNMPDGPPVAGILEVRKVDRKNETIRLHRRSLFTVAAREVFSAANAEAEAKHGDCQIELAGNWRAIPEGREHDYAAHRHSGYFTNWNEDYGDELILTPGRHRIRIAVVCPSARAPFHGVIRALSNPREVELEMAPEAAADDADMPKKKAAAGQQPTLPEMIPVSSEELGLTFDRPAAWMVEYIPRPGKGLGKEVGVDFTP